MITGSPHAREKVRQIGAPSRKIGSKLVKTVSTGTTALSVRVVDSETLLLDGVFEVDACTVKVRNAHLVDHNFYAVTKVNAHIAVENALIEVELVDEPRASARLNGQTQAQIIATFLRHQATDLVRSNLGQDNPVGGSFNSGFSHELILRPTFQLCEQQCLRKDGAFENTEMQGLVRAVRTRLRVFDSRNQNLGLRKYLDEVGNKRN